MKFNEFLKSLREKNSLTQQIVADKMGVNVSTIQNWERGDNKPELNAIPNIASLYKVSTEDILKMLAVDLNLVNKVENIESNTIKYLDALPEDIDYSAIEDFKFTDKEQELFLIFALNVNCGGNPVPEMSKICISNLELALFFDKIEKYDLSINLKGLSEKGSFVFNKIKKLNGELFNVYNLNFKDLLSLFKVYKIQVNSLFIATILKELTTKEYYLEEYRKRYSYSSEESKMATKSEYAIDSNGKPMDRKDCLKYIDSSYYTIEDIECQDEMYQIEKETYFKKLEFYEKNKDLAEGLRQPTKYKEKFTLRAFPTEKAKKFVDYYLNEK